MLSGRHEFVIFLWVIRRNIEFETEYHSVRRYSEWPLCCRTPSATTCHCTTASCACRMRAQVNRPGGWSTRTPSRVRVHDVGPPPWRRRSSKSAGVESRRRWKLCETDCRRRPTQRPAPAPPFRRGWTCSRGHLLSQQPAFSWVLTSDPGPRPTLRLAAGCRPSILSPSIRNGRPTLLPQVGFLSSLFSLTSNSSWESIGLTQLDFRCFILHSLFFLLLFLFLLQLFLY